MEEIFGFGWELHYEHKKLKGKWKPNEKKFEFEFQFLDRRDSVSLMLSPNDLQAIIAIYSKLSEIISKTKQWDGHIRIKPGVYRYIGHKDGKRRVVFAESRAHAMRKFKLSEKQAGVYMIPLTDWNRMDNGEVIALAKKNLGVVFKETSPHKWNEDMPSEG